MNRRIDSKTAEKVRLALLTKAAFGLDAGVHVAKHYELPDSLVTDIFARTKGEVRKDVADLMVEVERRRQPR
jgi:hypothetical protein